MRYSILTKVQEMITFRACKAFKLHLQRRGYSGSLSFDHDEERLEMKVCMYVHAYIRTYVVTYVRMYIQWMTCVADFGLHLE